MTVRVTLALARRALRNALRRPQFLAPLLIFPTMFLAVNTGGLERTTQLPGFPDVAGFFDYQLGAAMTQSLLLGGISTGIASALEIEGGFFDRLVAAPVPRLALALGRLVAAGVIAVAQILWFLVLGWIFGAEVQSGVPGVAVIVVIGTIAGIGFGAIGQALAFHAKNASTVQGVFPLVFVVLFLSSAFFPQDLLRAPADIFAAYNPLSYVAEGLREPIIRPLEAAAVLQGLAAAVGIAVVATGLSLLTLRGRLRDA